MPLKAAIENVIARKRNAPTEGGGGKLGQDRLKVPQMATVTTASIFVAVCCLVFAGVTHVQASSAMAKLQENLVTVTVAAQDIPQGATVKESMLTSVQIPQAYASSEAAASVEDAIGKQALVRIDKNAQVRTSELAGKNNTSALSGCLAKNKKAVSIDVSTETDFAKSLLHQGDRVSLYCFEKTGDTQEQKTICLAEDVPVIALDGFTSYADMTPEDGAVSYSNVTFEVDEKTAVKVRRYQDTGASIWMVLSASVDKKSR